jgi:hypothetical protein
MSCRRLSQCAYYDVAPSPASSMALVPKLIGARWNGSRDMETAGRCARAATRLPGAPTSRDIASLASPHYNTLPDPNSARVALSGDARRRSDLNSLRNVALGSIPSRQPQVAPSNTQQPPVHSPSPTTPRALLLRHRTPPATPHTILLLMTAWP